MKKYGGSRYNSLWDWSTWLIIAFVAGVNIWPIFLENDRTWQMTMIIITVLFLVVILVFLRGIYYRIDGENLVVYQFFIPHAFPIDKIESISPTKSILSSPATSVVHRIAIRFSDRKVLKSTMPLIISPVRQKEFIDELISINPNIRH